MAKCICNDDDRGSVLRCPIHSTIPAEQRVRGGPSDAAIEAARRWTPCKAQGTLRHALAASHDPALGLDRSVRLGDVVEWLRDPNTQAVAYRLGVVSASGFADLIGREFGIKGGPDGE